MKLLATIFLSASFGLAASVTPAASSKEVCAVKSIYIGISEGTADTGRYQYYIKKYLGKRGFKVMPWPSQADAILSIILSQKQLQTPRYRRYVPRGRQTRMYGTESIIQIDAVLQLKTPKGAVLWDSDIAYQGYSNAVKKHAKKTAKAIRKACVS